MKKKSIWLDRTLTCCSYYYCLCLSAEQYYAELRDLKVPETTWLPFMNKDANAGIKRYDEEKPLIFVCLDGELAKTKTPCQVAALLVHEAVHIWQRHASHIGSFNDHGDEEEAYAIQNIAQALFESYVEQTK